jgi:hypothetical protein
MGRIISVLLFAAAVLVAAIYVIKGKRVEGEDVRKARGWKRHLLAAVALVLAIIGARGLGNAETGDAGGTPTPGSEKPARPGARSTHTRKRATNVSRRSRTPGRTNTRRP